MFLFSISLAVISNVFYHLTLKFTPAKANPAFSLFISYAVAAVLCLLLLSIFPLHQGLRFNIQRLNWASYALGFAIVGLEIAFLFAYRSGWEISLAALIVNSTVSLILLPLGMFLFREHLSPVNLVGAVVSIAGLIMMNL